MAALFKTGEELREEQLAKAHAATQKAIRARPGFEKDKGLASIGAGLGGLLGGKIGKELAPPKEAAGDVDITQYDLGSSKGNIEAARDLRAQGFEEEAQKLEDRGIKLYNYESKLAGDAASASGDDTDWMKRDPNPSKAEVDGFALHWTGRNDKIGDLAREIIESDDVALRSNFDLMNRLAKTEINQLYNVMRAKGVSPDPVLLERTFVETLAGSGTMQDESWFGGVFGVDPVLDENKMKDTITAVSNAVKSQFMDKKGEKAEEPVEPTPSTKMDDSWKADVEGGTDGVRDVKGSIEPETPTDPGTELKAAVDVGYRDPIPEGISRTNKQKLMDIDRKIDKFAKDPSKKKVVKSLLKNREQVYRAATRGK